MQRYYSPSAGGFFAEDVHGAIDDPETLVPEDAIAIDDATWRALLEATSHGQVIVIEAGQPVAADAPEEEA